MAGRRDVEGRPGRWQRQRAWAAAIFGLGFLLFVWPFVRSPPLGLGLSYAHLIGAWALVIAALCAMSRSLGPGKGGGGAGDG